MKMKLICGGSIVLVLLYVSYIEAKHVVDDENRDAGEWTTGVWLNDDASQIVTNIESDSFNSLFSACPVVQYIRNGAVYAVYVRTSPVPPDFNAFSVFTDTWASRDNLLNTDFKLYNGLEDAKVDTDAWQFCNYDDNDIGFPRDCGQKTAIASRWFSMPGVLKAPGIMSGVGFDIYTGSTCPVPPGCLKEDDTDYWGNDIDGDIEGKKRKSVEECANWCGVTPTCNAWTLRKSDNWCWIKTSSSGKRTLKGFLSGSKKCATELIDGTCYEDDSSRLLDDRHVSATNTPDECIATCASRGYSYAGVQYSKECHCGNDEPPASRIRESSQCDAKCSGDASLSCGGTWRVNIYTVKTGKIWGEWSEWSEVIPCSRRCGGGNQKLTRSRSCSSSEGCDGESEFTERECYTQDCQCKILTNQQTGQQTGKVASFCSKFPRKITYREKEDFCKLSKTEKLEALLCTKIPSAEAETLLNVAYEKHVENCKYDPKKVFDGDCGQLLRDKLTKSCNNADCKSKQSQVQKKIDNVIQETDKLYRKKIEEINIMASLTKGQLELNIFATKIKDYGEKQKKIMFEKKVEEFMGDVEAKLKNKANMGKDEKKKVKDKASKLFRQDAVDSINTEDATKELNRLKEKENSMKGASTGIKKQYNRLKENIRGMSSTDKLEKAGKAVGHVLSSITKFKQGDTVSVIGGVLDIAAGITQFLPPPISIITETISSIFSIFSGKSGPTTESVIKDEFKKQKEWMEKKFDKVDKRFDGLEDKIKNYFESIDKRQEKSFDDLKIAIERITMTLTESQKDLLLLKGLTDQKRDALGHWHKLKLKLAFIIDNEGTDHTVHGLNLIVQSMNFFNDESAKFKFRYFVKTECKNKKSTGFREHCLVLAYAALMIERTDEIILTRTMALLAKSGSHSSIDYTSLLKTRKEIALKFLQDIFTSTDENEYSYISCGLSENSKAKLTDEQKKNLYYYAAHLNPAGPLTKKMKEREKCVDGSISLPWKTYSRSSPDRNAALDGQIDVCCKKRSALEIMTCSKPKNGGVDCPSSSRCHGYIPLGYCSGVKSNEIIPGTVLLGGDTLTSPNGKYKLVMQTDGNLSFYSIKNGQPYWNTNTRDTCPGAYFLFETGGNLVIYNRNKGVCWASKTGGQGAGKLTITDDINLKLTHKTFDSRVIWNMRAMGLHHKETSGFTLDGGGWGTWGSGQKCSFPHFVSKMELKIQDYRRCFRSFWSRWHWCREVRGENTALNGIRLTCSDGTTLTSTVGPWGNWKGIKQCNEGSYINQAKIRKEFGQGSKKDDSTANGIKFKCVGSNAELSPGDGWFGAWQQWRACPRGSAIVGLKTMVEPKISGDNTALNKVNFFCALLL